MFGSVVCVYFVILCLSYVCEPSSTVCEFVMILCFYEFVSALVSLYVGWV